MNQLALGYRDIIGQMNGWDRMGLKMKRDGRWDKHKLVMGGTLSNLNYSFILGDEMYVSSIP